MSFNTTANPLGGKTGNDEKSVSLLDFRHLAKSGNESKDPKAVDGYFLKDGSTEPRNVLPMAEFRNLPIENVPPSKMIGVPLTDDEDARIARIRHFESKTAVSAVNLQDCTSVQNILSYGETVVATLDCTEIQNHPSSTSSNMNVVGLCTASLIQDANGFSRLQISVAQGEYTFRANENFDEFIALSSMGCCCIISCRKGFNYSNMAMKYELQRTVLAQDCSIPVQDSVIDAMVYRKSVVHNRSEISSTALQAGGDLGGCCGTCIKNCFSFYASQVSLWFLCYEELYRCHPTLQKIYDLICCKGMCTKCCTWECIFCYKETGTDRLQELTLNAEDRYVIGAEYQQKIVKPRYEPPKEPKEPLWLNCPWYCGGICCQYPEPLPYGNWLVDNFGIYYCCASSVQKYCRSCANPIRYSNDPRSEGPEWKVKLDQKNEIVVTIHYRHLVDRKTKQMNFVIKPPADSPVDKIYTDARKFVNALGKLRGSLQLEMKDCPPGTRRIPTLNEVNRAGTSSVSASVESSSGESSGVVAMGMQAMSFITQTMAKEAIKEAI